MFWHVPFHTDCSLPLRLTVTGTLSSAEFQTLLLLLSFWDLAYLKIFLFYPHTQLTVGLGKRALTILKAICYGLQFPEETQKCKVIWHLGSNGELLCLSGSWYDLFFLFFKALKFNNGMPWCESTFIHWALYSVGLSMWKLMFHIYLCYSLCQFLSLHFFSVLFLEHILLRCWSSCIESVIFIFFFPAFHNCIFQCFSN
jgi:hypothetical protein